MSRPPIFLTILLALACLSAAHMVAVIIWDVLLRYVVNEAPGLADVDDVHRDLAWAVMLACGAALVWRHQPAASAAPGWQPRPWQRITGAIVAVVTALVFVALAVLALRKLNASIATGEKSAIGEQPVWPLRLAPVVGFALAALIFVTVAIARVRARHAEGRDGTP
jgi:TRAP-type C4-dicarboxylate transport system permease small subunit